MINPSNGLSLLRAPLAFLFLVENPGIRLLALFLAMFTDCIDGYLARRYRYSSKLGAVLDPIMDKFFVYFVLGIFFVEQKIELWECFATIARDFFLCLFALFLFVSKRWKNFEFHSIRWGKVTTAAQFFVIIALIFSLHVPLPVYLLFILFGCLAFLELLLAVRKQTS